MSSYSNSKYKPRNPAPLESFLIIMESANLHYTLGGGGGAHKVVEKYHSNRCRRHTLFWLAGHMRASKSVLCSQSRVWSA